MPPDDDFAAYVAARWPALVRSVVLLGVRPDVAEEVVRAGLARCHATWERVRRDDDLDVHVLRQVLERWRLARRRPVPGALGDLDPGVERLMDGLVPTHRAAVVVHGVAGLEETQVADVLDLPVGTVAGWLADAAEPLTERGLRDAAAAVEVVPPAAGVVLAEARGLRRRRVRGGVAGLAALALVAAVVGWSVTRPDAAPPAASAARVTQAENAAGIVWWADGVLHLQQVEVTLPDVAYLVQVHLGAAVVDDRGEVSFVAFDGTVTPLGRTQPGGTVVASDSTGWVSWVDTGQDVADVMVYDVVGRRVLAHRVVLGDPAAARPIALDRSILHFASAAGEWDWELPGGRPHRVPRQGLLAVAAATRVLQSDPGHITIVEPFFSVTYNHAGTGAQLSPDGDQVLTRVVPPDSPDPDGEVVILDTRTGQRLWDGVRRFDRVVATSLGAADTVTYVVTRRAEDLTQRGDLMRSAPSGPFELRSCQIDTRTCRTVVRFPQTGARPVLPD